MKAARAPLSQARADPSTENKRLVGKLNTCFMCGTPDPFKRVSINLYSGRLLCECCSWVNIGIMPRNFTAEMFHKLKRVAPKKAGIITTIVVLLF